MDPKEFSYPLGIQPAFAISKSEETGMSNPNNANFQRMMQLAEFGAKRHDERRQVEFRIFIAYNTLLVLAFYQIEKIEALKAPGLVVFGLIVIHVAYLLWEVRLSRALVNDALRRIFT